MSTPWNIQNGTPTPYGSTWLPVPGGYNFALYSKSATEVTLFFFHRTAPGEVVAEFKLDPQVNKTGTTWHCFIAEQDLHGATCYAYRVKGPHAPGDTFNSNKLLMDPWAKGVYFPPRFSLAHSRNDGVDNIGRAMLGLLSKETIFNEDPFFQNDTPPRHYHDLIIYELHVKGFTMHESSGVLQPKRGTFSGIIEKIPYLKELGITAIELMPVHQFNPLPSNYWGYMTINFFAPHNNYCLDDDANEQILEFRKMVLALHEAGIEVILDVIYNHSAEGGNSGPFFSCKGIDNSSYYLLTPDLRDYIDDAGTGNTLRASHKMVRKLILDSLRYWVQEMNVDGFRFDLATIFTRNDDGTVNLSNPPILEEISMDPVLRNVRLIAEPWDITSYQLGHRFPGANWSQWNGAYRDDIRRFVKGDNDHVARLITRIYGSDDLFPGKLPFSCRPFQSINFVTSHDGFSLYDLVSYNTKHNDANGEHNRDGSNDNFSWNCGMEGDTGLTEEILKLRIKQSKNFMTILMLSNGIPMFRMGDEFLQTQKGNNNAYNQDNEISWLNWNRKNEFNGYFQFICNLIKFRKEHPSLSRFNFWEDDIHWYGVKDTVDMSYFSHSLAFLLKGSSTGDSDIYVMINAYWEDLIFEIQTETPDQWRRIVDTSLESPGDFTYFVDSNPLATPTYSVGARSIVVLEKEKPG